MFLHDLLKQVVFAGVALALSAYLWTTFANQVTGKMAESIKNQKPMEFKSVEFKPAMKFDSNSVIWKPPTINVGDFQRKSTGQSKPTSRKRAG
jgi:hypothetical protein